MRTARTKQKSAARLSTHFAAALLTAFVALQTPALAQSVTVQGREMNGYGRIALTFETPRKVKARVTGTVLVVEFDSPATLPSERLSQELSRYASTVRRDPSDTGFRMALTNEFRVNVLTAGEKVFIDLLPTSWRGMPPSLPQEVIDDLAQRALAKEANVQEELRKREATQARPLMVRVARGNGKTRLVFDPPRVMPITMTQNGQKVLLRFEAPLTLNADQVKALAPELITAVKLMPEPTAFTVELSLAANIIPSSFREDESLVLDLATPMKPVSVPDPVQGSGVVRPEAQVAANSIIVQFPFQAPTPAVAFVDGNTLRLGFQTTDSVMPIGTLPKSLSDGLQVRRKDALSMIEMPVPAGLMPSLLPDGQEGNGWKLVFSETPQLPQTLTPERVQDAEGLSALLIPAKNAASVTWFDRPERGDRVALIPLLSQNGRTQGVSPSQVHVEAAIAETLGGIAVIAVADTVKVTATKVGVLINQPVNGLSITQDVGDPILLRQPNAAITNSIWQKHTTDDVRERWRELDRAVAAASDAMRPRVQIELAEFLLRHDLNHEAEDVLNLAAKESPSAAASRRLNVLRAAASVRAKHDLNAKAALQAPILENDPEAILWKAVFDAREGRAEKANNGFHRARAMLTSYPPELQSEIRHYAADAALKARDFAHAEQQLMALANLPGGDSSEVTLLNARFAEGVGQVKPALATYQSLIDDPIPRVAAEAGLRAAQLGLAEKAYTPDQAREVLENARLLWRGDALEAEMLSQLGPLYAQAKDWRPAFHAARVATQKYPDIESSRTLYEETARYFEALFLEGKADSLRPTEALGLYFDFKEFTPIGRRGDEMIRRLSDRLVALDLLEPAASLLQHQVDRRLSGVARAQVAARLAAVRLMDQQPMLALQTLQTSRSGLLSVDHQQARTLLEARALGNLSRYDAALDILAADTSEEADRLRSDLLWQGKKWLPAGEAFERRLPRDGTLKEGQSPLGLRAAIAYTLAQDPLSLERLKGKYQKAMSATPDARAFTALVRGNDPVLAQSLADTVTSSNLLSSFLTDYRKKYPDIAPSAPQKSGPDGAGQFTTAPTPAAAPAAASTPTPTTPPRS
jgi:hypothetical protein